MSEHDLDKLLGGFAADTLTAEERARLYRAALEDQTLFDRLADEQALKELLTDPAVRSRLLEALRGAPGLEPARGASWWEWFRRPMNVALAGGLASAAIAFVLGLTIYRDNLTRAARETPAAREGLVQQPSATVPSSQAARQPASPGKDLPPEPAPAPRSETARKEEASRDRTADSKNRRMETAPSRHLDTERAGDARLQDQFLETRPGGAPAESAAPSMEVQPADPAAGSPASVRSARSLFYRSAEPQRMPERLTTAREADEAEFTQPEKKGLQRTPKALGKLEAVGGRPLGVRYSLMIKGPGGLDLEIDPTTAVGQDDVPRVTVQTTAPGYLSIRVIHGDRTALLVAPAPVAARTPVTTALTGVFEQLRDADRARLLVLFTRTEQHDAGMAPPSEAPQARLLVEQVSPETQGAPAEQALYVVDPRPESARLLVEVPLNLRP